jgi:hypothetical protein
MLGPETSLAKVAESNHPFVPVARAQGRPSFSEAGKIEGKIRRPHRAGVISHTSREEQEEERRITEQEGRKEKCLLYQ